MEPVSALASVIQIVTNAASAVTKAIQFINDVKDTPGAQEELRSRLNNVKTTLGRLNDVIHYREARLGGNGKQPDFRQEEKDLFRQATYIWADCEKCVHRLEKIYNRQNNSLALKIKSQVVQGIKKSEIERLELRIQTNLANMQLLLSFLNIFAHDNQVERDDLEKFHSDIQKQIEDLQQLRDGFSEVLTRFIEQAKPPEHTAESSPVQENWTLLIDAEEDCRDLINTTDGSIKTARTLVDKWSNSGSESTLSGSRNDDDINSENSNATGDRPISSSSRNPDMLELTTHYLDEYIRQANQELKEGNYSECEKYLKSALDTGVELFHKNGQAFEQWFELQLLLANVYQYQGKSDNALDLIMKLMSGAMEDGPEYTKITPLRTVQLQHAIAKFYLERYGTHSIALADVEKYASTAYTSSSTLQGRKGDGSYSGDTLSQLLDECAITYGRVLEMQEDQVKLKVLKSRHPAVKEYFKRRESCTSTSTDSTHETRSQAPTEITIPPVSNIVDTKLASPTSPRDAPIISRKEPIDVNDRDSDGMTALHHAIRGVSCDLATISKLIKQGIDVNAADSNGDTALHYSVKFNQPEAARILLRSGRVDLEATNKEGKTPAHLAANRNGGTEILKLLIDHGATLDKSQIHRTMLPIVDSLMKQQKGPGRRGSRPFTAQQGDRRKSGDSSHSQGGWKLPSPFSR